MIYHLTFASDWESSQSAGQYRMSSRGMTLDEVGFIHCSFADQVDGVARAVFAGADGLVLVTIDPSLVKAEVQYENLEGGSELFPHIYGPLNVDAVVEVRAYESQPRPDGR